MTAPRFSFKKEHEKRPMLKDRLPCLNPECGSSDARRMYEGGTSFCFSCRKYFPADASYGHQGYQEEAHMSSPKLFNTKKSETYVTLEEINEFTCRGIRARGITTAICEFFGIKLSFDNDGNIACHYYPYLTDNKIGYKQRIVDTKQFFWVGQPGEVFGIDKFPAGGKRLVITEGEIDALSVAQAYKIKYDKIYPVISVTSATGIDKLLKHREWIRAFDEVVLWFDNDQAGKEALERALKIVGIDKAKIATATSGSKDANDVLMKDGSNAVLTQIWDAQPWTPAGIIKKEDLWEALCKYNEMHAVPYPSCIGSLNAKVKGMRLGEIALFVSGTGCLGYDTKVLMFDGSLKAVQDIVVGDLLMGPDNCPREVLQLFRGQEQLYHVGIRGNEGFICNESHVLSVVNNDSEGRWGLAKDEIVDVSLKDYQEWSDKRKHLSKAFKVGCLEFPAGESLPIPPYVLGAWLGDGYSAGGRLSSADPEIPAKIAKLGFIVSKQSTEFAWGLLDLQEKLRALQLINNKHIPELYLRASVSDRLELLAGLIDTDGSYDPHNNGYEFSQKSEIITNQFIRLVNSLGFQATKGKQVNNKFGNCFRVWVSGDGLENIPVALPRKQANPRQQVKNPLRFKMEITKLEVGDYYGFEVDGDGRFVLGNFLVTHNSGKSTLLREIIIHLLTSCEIDSSVKIGIVSLEESPAETARKLAGMAIMRNPANEEIPLDELKPGFDKIFGDDRVILLDHQGAITDDSIVDQLEYMALMGCKYLFIDHITILVSEGSEGLTGNEAIDKVMNDLLKLTKRHDVWIGLVSHLRKTPGGGKTFEAGNIPTLDDIRGSGSIKQISFDVIGFARNMMADSERERNSIKMAVLKCRHTGLTGAVSGSFYNSLTGRLVPIAEAPTDEFVEII